MIQHSRQAAGSSFRPDADQPPHRHAGQPHECGFQETAGILVEPLLIIDGYENTIRGKPSQHPDNSPLEEHVRDGALRRYPAQGRTEGVGLWHRH